MTKLKCIDIRIFKVNMWKTFFGIKLKKVAKKLKNATKNLR